MAALSLCDCGASKPRTHECCLDCSWLDGIDAAEGRIIDALRAHVTPVNVDEIAAITGVAPRSILRTIKPLIRIGRVIRTPGERTTYKLGEKK